MFVCCPSERKKHRLRFAFRCITHRDTERLQLLKRVPVKLLVANGNSTQQVSRKKALQKKPGSMICNLATALSTVHTVNCADVSYPAHPVGIRCLSNFAIVLQQRDAKTDEFASKALKNPHSHLLLRGEKCKTQYALGRNM